MKPVEPADIISAGPRRLPSWAAWLVALMLLAAALAKSIVVAVHYHNEVLTLRRQAHLPRLSASPSPAQTLTPTLISETSTLPSSRPLTVQVIAFTARSSAGSAWVIVTARVSGGRPLSRYELTGGDCAGDAHGTWAAGFTSAHGSADLTGRVVKVSSHDEYYLILSAPGLGQSHPGPALHGYFGIAHGLAAVHDGFPPCAP